ncbi:hypothetical protein JXC34_04115 [Candidatus Woesearchaeota archaeon]|nr:hypothetical protein [Candidatus Woesearchaeota archaeon]
MLVLELLISEFPFTKEINPEVAKEIIKNEESIAYLVNKAKGYLKEEDKKGSSAEYKLHQIKKALKGKNLTNYPNFIRTALTNLRGKEPNHYGEFKNLNISKIWFVLLNDSALIELLSYSLVKYACFVLENFKKEIKLNQYLVMFIIGASQQRVPKVHLSNKKIPYYMAIKRFTFCYRDIYPYFCTNKEISFIKSHIEYIEESRGILESTINKAKMIEREVRHEAENKRRAI